MNGDEPLITIASITALVVAVLGLLVAFGVTINDQQQKAILAFFAVVAPWVVAVIGRRHVTPNSKLPPQ